MGLRLLEILVMILALGFTPQAASALDSEKIHQQVRQQLIKDPLLSGQGIDSRYTNRVVMLSGTVDNIMASKRATELALLNRDVDSVINKIKVVHAHRSPKTLAQHVLNSFKDETTFDLSKIQVQASRDGQVVLLGKVDSAAKRQLAQEMALHISGVTGVINGIDVVYDSPRSDQEMQNEIRQRLYWSALVDSLSVSSIVADSHAILSGTVGSLAEKEKAINEAWVRGINSVNAINLRVVPRSLEQNLRLARRQLPTDSKIKSAIHKAFLWDPRVVASNVEIAVNKGVVTLQGQVPTQQAKYAASHDARNTYGVIDVRNNIKVLSTRTMAATP